MTYYYYSLDNQSVQWSRCKHIFSSLCKRALMQKDVAIKFTSS